MNLARAYFQSDQIDKASDVISIFLSENPKIDKTRKAELKDLLKAIKVLKERQFIT